MRLTAGDRRIAVAIPRIFEGLPPRYGGPTRREAPATRERIFTPPAARPPSGSPAANTASTMPGGRAGRRLPLNGARVSAVDVGGPYAQATGPSRASSERIYMLRPRRRRDTSAACTTRIMTDLARRAFRRPVGAHEAAKYIALVRQAQKAEGSFDEGLAVGLQALLVSPDFLFRIERPAGSSGVSAGAAQPITQHELATRLSYFLWASMPDAALRRAADAGTLRDPRGAHRAGPPDVARSEVARARRAVRRPVAAVPRARIDDAEPRALSGVRGLPAAVDAPRDRAVRRARHPRRIAASSTSSTARYSFINERLARHYGIAGVSGPEFRRVDLTGTPRGGVLTQAACSPSPRTPRAPRRCCAANGFSTTCSTRRRPIRRPTSRTSTKRPIGTAATMREQLEAHRKNPTCASCHRRMDPLGFGLENFDAVGAWRTMDGKFPIDASGFLPDGDEFTGPEELRGILSETARRVRRGPHVQAADLRAWARPRALRHAHGEADRRPAAGAQLPVLGSRPGDRQQPAVPVAQAYGEPSSPRSQTRNAMIVTRRHLPRRTFLKGMGAAIALPALDAMTPGLRQRPWRRPPRQRRRSASPSPTCPTA